MRSQCVNVVRGVVCGLIGGMCAGVSAGPLAPPAGPIGPTYRTLGEVEPRLPVNAQTAPGTATAVHRITQSGSYFLTGDVVVPAGKSGIVLGAANITLDMRGFTIRGEVGSVDGIADEAGSTGAHVFNGNFVNLGSHGLNGNFSTNSRFTELSAAGCHALRAMNFPSSSVVERCTASANVNGGIATGSYVTISNCVSTQNGGTGFSIGTGNTVTSCVASQNSGTAGFVIGEASYVSGCTARANTQDGFLLGARGEISDSSAYFNSDDGFQLGSPGTDSNSVIRRCTAIQNTNAGIRAASGRATIDENVCRINGTGIVAVVTSSANSSFITRNVCASNSPNYNVGAGNSVGTVVWAPVVGIAINGNSGGGLGTTDPWANFAQ